jgi:hypothetical protein
MNDWNYDNHERVSHKSINNNKTQAREKPKVPAFTIKHRVEVALDLNLALDIGDFLVACKPENPAIMAFALQLQNLVPPS